MKENPSIIKLLKDSLSEILSKAKSTTAFREKHICYYLRFNKQTLY